MKSFCRYSLFYVIVAMVVAVGICGCGKRSEKPVVVIVPFDTVSHCNLDSLFAEVDRKRDSVIAASNNKDQADDNESSSSYSHSSSSSSSSYSSSSETDDRHPGTRPDDGMFGFDPRDDLDDAYSDDHFQQDSRPDDAW